MLKEEYKGLIIYCWMFFSVVLILIPSVVYLRYNMKLDILYAIVGGTMIYITFHVILIVILQTVLKYIGINLIKSMDKEKNITQ